MNGRQFRQTVVRQIREGDEHASLIARIGNAQRQAGVGETIDEFDRRMVSDF